MKKQDLKVMIIGTAIILIAGIFVDQFDADLFQKMILLSLILILVIKILKMPVALDRKTKRYREDGESR